MIFALLFAAVFALSGGGSPYLVPKMDKYVKKSVVDKEREKQALIHLKESKKERKVYVKAEKKFRKDMESLFNDRETRQVHFDTLFIEVIETRKNYQLKSQQLAAEIQKQITREEWGDIRLLVKKDQIKTEKTLDKKSIKTDKDYDKLRKNVEKIVENRAERDRVLEALDHFKKSADGTFQSMVKKVFDEDSPHYQYEASQTDLIKFQSEINSGVEELLKTLAQLHFKLLEATTEQEWEKLHKKNISLPF
jgi:hypothetical protein